MNNDRVNMGRRAGAFLAAAAAIGLAFCLVLATLRTGRPWAAAFAGWLAAAFQAAFAEWIHRKALGKPHFLAWVAGSLLARMAYLLGALAWARGTPDFEFTMFATALLISYLSFLYVEVARMLWQSMAWSSPARLDVQP